MTIFDTVEEYWGDKELDQAILATASCTGREIEEFEQQFLGYLGSNGRAIFVPSGREAIKIALGILCPDRSGLVVMPAFCCSVVGEAVLRAGMRPLLIDSGPTIGSVDWNACETAMKAPGVRAVIIPHLFGLPLDLAPVVELAARRGIAIIEDCAHCLGGKVSDRMAGTMGDFAVFSFSYDKPISLGGGGMLVCNQEQLPREFAEFRMRRRSGPGAWDEEIGNLREFRAWLARKRSALALSSVSTRARFVGRVRGSIEDCVRIRWMLKRFITPRGMFRLPPTVGSVRAELGRGLLSTYDCIRTHRIRNHESLARELESTGCVEMMSAPHDVAPAWLKAKLRLAPSVEDRVAPVCERLRSAGFAAGRLNWPRTLDREASTAFSARSIGSLDNAHRMAASAIDLPIHQRMGDRQLREMALQIRECAEPRNRR